MKKNGIERLPVARILVGDESPKTKEMLFRVLETAVMYHEDRASYEAVSMRINGFVSNLAFWVCPGLEETGSRVTLYEPAIHVNCSDFVLTRRDYRDLIPFVVIHEKTEIWNISGRKMWAEEGTPEQIEYDDLSHEKAVVAEYMAAIRQGKGGRHLGFMVEFGEKIIHPRNRNGFITENLWGYDRANRILSKRRNLD